MEIESPVCGSHIRDVYFHPRTELDYSHAEKNCIALLSNLMSFSTKYIRKLKLTTFIFPFHFMLCGRGIENWNCQTSCGLASASKAHLDKYSRTHHYNAHYSIDSVILHVKKVFPFHYVSNTHTFWYTSSSYKTLCWVLWKSIWVLHGQFQFLMSEQAFALFFRVTGDLHYYRVAQMSSWDVKLCRSITKTHKVGSWFSKL